MITSGMFKKIAIGFILSLFFVSAHAAVSQLPFLDVKQNDELYPDLSLLYRNNVIKDTSDNLFRPDALISRDEFLGIVVGVGCQDCLNPTTEDFIKYDISPFVDLSKFDPYYYCIAKGKDEGITQGYLLDSSGKYTCQNKVTYTQTPFCPENSITRIEAVAMLLRTSKIWNDVLNSNVSRTTVIADVDDQWYGFAKKGIDTGILKIDKSNKVYPNEYINRREFVHMAAKIFGLNFCDANDSTKRAKAGVSSDIQIFDKQNPGSCSGQGNPSSLSDQTVSTYDFHAETQSVGDFEYLWEFTNTTTGEVKKMTGPCLNDFDLGSSGKWIIKLTIKDKNTGESGVSYSQLNVSKDPAKKILSADISGSPLSGEGPLNVNFDSIIKGNQGSLIYVWDFGDGTTSNESDPSHTYEQPGVYPVTLKVIDEKGNTGIAQVTIEVLKTKDSDGDSVRDILDKCPTIAGLATNQGCPKVDEYGKAPQKNNEDISSEIKIFDKENANSCSGDGNISDLQDKTRNIYDFYGYSETSGDLEYIWEFTNTTTGEKITTTGRCLNDFILKSNGVWTAKLVIRDKTSGKESVSYSQVIVNMNGSNTGSGSISSSALNKMISVVINADPLSGTNPLPSKFDSTVSGGSGSLIYKWDFGDGSTSSQTDPQHTYIMPGVYTVTLTVKDSSGNIGKSQLVIVVKGASGGISGINNICLANKVKGKGAIEGLLSCNSCPCNYSMDFTASLRSCDIVFPAITSPDKKTLYSRGPVFQIQ